MKAPQTLQQAIQHFSDEKNCREFMIAMRWPDDKVRCPTCGSEMVTWLENAKLYFCSEKHEKQKFSLKVGTIFEDSPIRLEKWLPAMWLLCNAKNGISSYELHRALGVTQKTAWFMLHRIRLAMKNKSLLKLGYQGGPVEMDETFIGGKLKNMHKSKKPKGTGFSRVPTGAMAKTIVVGILRE
jgi:transposase-like protein